MRILRLTVLAAVPVLISGCTSFSTVRSAEVRPGPSLGLQASLTTRTGDVAGWFWSYDCVERCDHSVVGGDAGLTYGWPGIGGRAVAIGAGVNGLLPYIDAYMQLAEGPRPFGIGGRLGLPTGSWQEHQLYGRYDVPLGDDTRLLLNPALFIHTGTAPNGASPGSFIAFVQGVGLLYEGRNVSFTPSVAFVAGRAQRTTDGRRIGPERSLFGTLSLALEFHRRRKR